jgi:hypothetical protein
MKQQEIAPESCERCKRWKEVKQRMKVADLLASAGGKIAKKMQDGDWKPTLAEYLKLLQLEQEFEEESPKEIKVTWVEPTPTSAGEK